MNLANIALKQKNHNWYFHGETLTTSPIIIFDSHIDELPLLMKGVKPGFRSYVLDPQKNGIQQITEILNQQSTMHLVLVAHGFPGGLQLGSSSLELNTLHQYEALIKSWFNSSAASELTLLSCNVAAGDAGHEFINTLAKLTNAHITASVKPLGNGEWLPVADKLFTPDTLQGYRAKLNWEVVAQDPLSGDIISYADLEVGNDTPYVVLKERGSKSFSVQKFENDTWTNVGNPEFETRGLNYNVDIEIANNTPYIAFIDDAERKTSVIQFANDEWTPVGELGFSAGRPEYIDLSVSDSGQLYLLYTDTSKGRKAVLQTFTNGEWVSVGSNDGFSAGEIVPISETNPIDLEIIGETPYAIYNYIDDNNTNQVIVQAFVNGAWSTIGNSDFSTVAVNSPSLESYNGVPYIVYSDPANEEKITVKTLDTTTNTWVNVGSNAPSRVPAGFADLEFDHVGTPHIIYRNNVVEGKATVVKLENGEWVSTSERRFFSKADVSYTDLAFDTNGNAYAFSRGDSEPTVHTLRNPNPPDRTAPTVTSIKRLTPDTESTSDDTLIFQIVFSEDVTNVDLTTFKDFVVSGSTAEVTAISSLNNRTYNITVSGGNLAELNGIVGINLAADQTITDLQNNRLITLEPTIDETYTITNSTNTGEATGETTTTSLLTPLSVGNVLEVTQLGNAQSLNLEVVLSKILAVGSLRIFSTDDNGGNRSQIGAFSIVENANNVLKDFTPMFNLLRSDLANVTHLQFELEENGITSIATLETLAEGEVSLTFTDGTQLTTALETTAPSAKFLDVDAETIDLTDLTGSLTIEGTIRREAALNNVVDFYITDANGAVFDKATDSLINPGEAGYKEAALANRLNINLAVENGEAKTFSADITGGQHFGIFATIGDVDPEAAQAGKDIFFSHNGANNGLDRFKNLGDNTFGLEDQSTVSGENIDFNDMVVSFNIV